MTRILNHLVLALLLFTTHTLGQQQAGEDTWASYKPGKLSNIIKVHSNPADMRDKGVDVVSEPVRARVTYAGISRPILAAKQRYIALYMESVGTPEIAKKFMTEVLFVEDGDEFWLPVQDALLPYLGKELHRGDKVTLFANWIGITYTEQGGSGLHVFLVNEFDKSIYAQQIRLTVDQWGTLTSPDGDFTVEFPVEPKRDEYLYKSNAGSPGTLARRYSVFTNTMMLTLGFQSLDYGPNSPFANRIAPTYEQKIKVAARQRDWKIIRMQRLSNSIVEMEL